MSNDSSQTSETPRVLVVDDDTGTRYLVREAFESVGIEVEEAADGKTCVESFAARRPDAVLLDLIMPGLDGFQTCQELKKLPGGAAVPIILMTGADDIASIRHAFEAGVTDFILKPVNGLILAQRIRYILKATSMFKDLQKSEALLQTSQRLARLGSWEWDVGAKTILASEECCRIYELPIGVPIVAQDILRERIHPEYRASFEAATGRVAKDGTPFSMDHTLVLPSGTTRHVHTEVQPTLSDDGKVRCLQGAVQDVSEIRAAQAQAQFMAHYDSVTGLPNRVLYLDRLRQAIAHAQRNGTNMGVLFLDLDRFKRVNDTFGHGAGDILLRAIGDRLESCLRGSDTVARAAPIQVPTCHTLARFGGDEFAIVLHDLRYVQSAAKVAQRILDAISSPVTVETTHLCVTGSIGIALFPSDGQSAEELLKNADTAMYSAKSRGKNTYQFFSKAMSCAASERLKLEGELRRAIEEDELVVYYQPKVDICSGSLAGCEALLRWRRGDNELVSPDLFMEVAEEARLMHLFDEWVLRQVCRQAREWRGRFESLTPIAINISDQTFHVRRFIDKVHSTLLASKTPAGVIELELTESIIMDDITNAVSKLEALRRIGVKTAIDDFGTGYSSLGHLKDLPLDHLKIDRTFIREVTTNTKAASLSRGIVEIGRALSLKVIGEGVETEAQLSFLRACGCHEAQGFLICPPSDVKTIEKFVEERGSRLLCLPETATSG